MQKAGSNASLFNMSCLHNYIGIKGCKEAESLSGYFINQLPGITLESMERIASSEQATFMGVWKDVQDRAWLRYQRDVRQALRSKYQLKTTKSNLRLLPTLSSESDSATGYLRGVVYDFGWKETGFLGFYIDKLQLSLTADQQSLNIFIYNQGGDLLDQLELKNAKAGKNSIDVARTYSAQRIFIATDAEILYKSELPAEQRSGCCEAICLVCGPDCGASVYGAEALSDSPAAISQGDNYFGFEISGVIKCDYSSIICIDRETFSHSWMYLLGAELMMERLYSSRMNQFTTIDKDQAEKLIPFYTVEYEKSLEETIKGLQIKPQQCCFECRQTISRKEVLP